MLPRGFSKTMRFMPAALAVADTGNSYSCPQRARATASQLPSFRLDETAKSYDLQ
jgi:hypothetical protein